jgi:hypothetical protein
MKNPIYILTLLIIFSLTVDYRFFSGIEGLPSITIVEALSYLAVVVLFAKLAMEGDELSKRIIAIHRNNRLIALYFIWTGLASLASLVRSSDALRFYKDLVPSLIVYFLVAISVRDLRAFKGVALAFLSGTALNLLLGLSQVVTGGPTIVDLNEGARMKMDLSAEVVSGNLATGFFTHPNGYALFLVPSAILIPALLFKSRSLHTHTKVLLLALWLLLFCNLWYTYAKVAFAFTLIGVTLIPVLGILKKRYLATGLAILTASIFGITAFSLWAYPEYGRLFGTMLARYELWKVTFLAIRSDVFVAILGNGFANMTGLSALYASMEYPNAHNAYLNQIIYSGFPALFLYIGMLTIALRRLANKLQSANDWQKTAGLFLFSALIALLGIYFFEPANQGVVEQAQLFVLLALASTISRMSSDASLKNHEKDRYLQNSISSRL